jgi:hypothetical protein
MSTKGKVFAALGVTAAFVVGMGAGAAAGPADDSAAPSDAITITEPGATVTQGVAIHDGTPQSCLDALDAAEVVNGDAAEFSQIVTDYSRMLSPAVKAAYLHDVAGMEAMTTKIQTIAPRIHAVSADVQTDGAAYASAAADCRADTP